MTEEHAPLLSLSLDRGSPCEYSRVGEVWDWIPPWESENEHIATPYPKLGSAEGRILGSSH